MSMPNDEKINGKPTADIGSVHTGKRDDETMMHSGVDQLIKREDREIGSSCMKPHLQDLFQNNGYVHASTHWPSNNGVSIFRFTQYSVPCPCIHIRSTLGSLLREVRWWSTSSLRS